MSSSVSTVPGHLTPAPPRRQAARRSAALRHRRQVPVEALPALIPSFLSQSPLNECPRFSSTRCVNRFHEHAVVLVTRCLQSICTVVLQ